MSYPIQPILANTEALLKLRHDETLTSTTPQRFHDCLGQAVMMAISKNWTESKKRREGHRKAYYLLRRNTSWDGWSTPTSSTWAFSIPSRRSLRRKGRGSFRARRHRGRRIGATAAWGAWPPASWTAPSPRAFPSRATASATASASSSRASTRRATRRKCADDWTRYGDPWSYRREKHAREGHLRRPDRHRHALRHAILGYHTDNIGTLRLWQCEPEQELDFDAFNARDLEKALQEKNSAEDITRVLYPNDETREGKLLRIRQQYVLSSASLQDILRVYRSTHGKDLVHLHEAAAIQLNDTHPALSIPELIRLLMAEGLDFDSAVTVAGKTFAYTNHTVMAEALETWDLDLMGEILPEIVENPPAAGRPAAGRSTPASP